MGDRKVSKKIFPILIIIGVLIAVYALGPAKALSLNLKVDSDSNVTLGKDVFLTLSTTFSQTDPTVFSATFILDDNHYCTFALDGTLIDSRGAGNNCNFLDATDIQANQSTHGYALDTTLRFKLTIHTQTLRVGENTLFVRLDTTQGPIESNKVIINVQSKGGSGGGKKRFVLDLTRNTNAPKTPNETGGPSASGENWEECFHTKDGQQCTTVKNQYGARENDKTAGNWEIGYTFDSNMSNLANCSLTVRSTGFSTEPNNEQYDEVVEARMNGVEFDITEDNCESGNCLTNLESTTSWRILELRETNNTVSVRRPGHSVDVVDIKAECEEVDEGVYLNLLNPNDAKNKEHPTGASITGEGWTYCIEHAKTWHDNPNKIYCTDFKNAYQNRTDDKSAGDWEKGYFFDVEEPGVYDCTIELQTTEFSPEETHPGQDHEIAVAKLNDVIFDPTEDNCNSKSCTWEIEKSISTRTLELKEKRNQITVRRPGDSVSIKGAQVWCTKSDAVPPQDDDDSGEEGGGIVVIQDNETNENTTTNNDGNEQQTLDIHEAAAQADNAGKEVLDLIDEKKNEKGALNSKSRSILSYLAHWILDVKDDAIDKHDQLRNQRKIDRAIVETDQGIGDMELILDRIDNEEPKKLNAFIAPINSFIDTLKIYKEKLSSL